MNILPRALSSVSFIFIFHTFSLSDLSTVLEIPTENMGSFMFMNDHVHL